jgi:hypothetical protein
MLPPGLQRQRLARTLNDAYAEGVLSENTLVHRLELLFARPLIDPASLVGDLPTRRARSLWATGLGHARVAVRRLFATRRSSAVLLALDWNGGGNDLLIGRHPDCDVVLAGPAVSRRHARLTFHDLDSTNGTLVNSARVGRCRLSAGDEVVIGDTQLVVD